MCKHILWQQQYKENLNLLLNMMPSHVPSAFKKHPGKLFDETIYSLK